MARNPLRLAVSLAGAVAALALASRAFGAGCTVSSTGVAFGSYSVFNTAPTSTTGTISYTCTLPASPPVISLNRGSSSAFFPRTLTTTGSSLQYNLYLDPDCTSIWGDGSSGTSVYRAGAPADGQNYNVTVYGLIPARQNVRAGAYTDSITITITF
jgi:spore coat protein U-like protein